MEGISQGCASVLFELCSRTQAGLPVSVACLLLFGDFEDISCALLGGCAGASSWGGTMSLCLSAQVA